MMRVRVNLVIDVPMEEWEEFGDTLGDVETRRDIRQYILHAAGQLAGVTETGATVTLRPS